ncbi:hypothetical protein KFK09_019880 [Dendrobium nobile]|uniref:Uncharacterized protein n=1 Tax=Dendrobium nobile TaxID=94219 RepID=A0A8T3AS88_DENNO|nr:hypothetical protein KFK09_019880 [Dendrobium nobile]
MALIMLSPKKLPQYNNYEALGFAFHLLFSSLLFGFVASQELQRLPAALLLLLLRVRLRYFDDFPSCRIGSYDILIGSKNGSSLAVKVTFSLSRASSAKSHKSAKPRDLVTPGIKL